MAAEVETMFSVRERPWHGLGTIVEEALDSETALKLAGLDWMVEQRQLYTEFGKNVPGYKVNIRDKDEEILGIVTDRYKVVQNTEAFAFTDELLGKGVHYETAGKDDDSVILSLFIFGGKIDECERRTGSESGDYSEGSKIKKINEYF